VSARLDDVRTEIAGLETEHKLREIAPLLREAVELTRDESGAESREYVAVLNELGSLSRTLKELDDSELRFREAARIEARVRGRTADYATCINNLAGTYRLKGDYDTAQSLFEEALEIYEAEVGREHFVYLSALNNLGLVYQDLKRFDDAERLHLQALAVLEKSGKRDTTFATTLNNLASVAMATGRYADAQNFLWQTLDLYKDKTGTSSVLYLTALNNLAAASFMAGDYPEAEARYVEAAASMERILGPDHPDTLRAQQNLHRTREKRG
jgi:tetratricopeptide (TPR) repeat protein